MEFKDAQQMARLHPDTFEAPTQEDLDSLEPGHYVKVCITNEECDERIWVEIDHIEDELITGTLANDPVVTNANFGDEVKFMKKHIYQTM